MDYLCVKWKCPASAGQTPIVLAAKECKQFTETEVAPEEVVEQMRRAREII